MGKRKRLLAMGKEFGDHASHGARDVVQSMGSEWEVPMIRKDLHAESLVMGQLNGRMCQCQGVTSLSNHVQKREDSKSLPPNRRGAPSPIHTGISGIHSPL